MNKKNKRLAKSNRNIIMLVPLATAGCTLAIQSIWIYMLVFISILLVVALNPACKGRESLWIFAITTFVAIPLNISLTTKVYEYIGWLLSGSIFTGIMYYILIYSIMFSIEQIGLGIIGRLIWRRQYKLNW